KDAADLHHERAEAVRRGDISILLDKIERENGPIAANRTRAALSAMWNWGIMEGGIVGANGEDLARPWSLTRRRGETGREHVLSDDEIRALWGCTDDGSEHSRIVRLLLLTGCRREEIGGLRWDEVGSEWITITRERMKGRQVHEVPILPAVRACLPIRPYED